MVVPALGAKPEKMDKAERREMRYDADAAPAKRAAPEDPQVRILAKLREQLEVADDAEWGIVSERIVRVGELRRVLTGSSAGPRSSVSLVDKDKRSSRTGTSAHPEQDALKLAVRDKLPDAEIKVRLARVHDVHRENELKLARAQGELRAVLTVRQEAVAVIAGLLPP